MLSAYSALNQGHRHPRIIQALKNQADLITLTSRAFFNDQLGPWCKELGAICKKQLVLPMNSGAEAVETAIKVARKWGEKVKKVPKDGGEIIVCRNNFSGRTTTLVSFSSEPQYKAHFGPFTPGFLSVEFGSALELEKAITSRTVAFLVEPIQGEGGVIVPPEGYLREVSAICKTHNVLLIVDEVQTGFARTGKMFAFEHDGISPDLIVMGKALGGGVFPISAVAGDRDTLGLLEPGDHGSTFGGNPLACAVSREAIRVIFDEDLCEKSRVMGEYFMGLLKTLPASVVKEVRGKGLLIAVELQPQAGNGRVFCEKLLSRGLLCKETRKNVVRFAPPLIIAKSSIEWGFEQIREVFRAPA